MIEGQFDSILDDNRTVFFIEGENYADLSGLSNGENIKEVVLENSIVDHEHMEKILKLERLERISFVDCSVLAWESLNKLHVKELLLNRCKIEDTFYLEIEGLISLYLDACEEVDLERIPVIRGLKELSLSQTHVKNGECFVYMNAIQKLRLDGSGVEDLSFCMVLDKLKYLVVDEEQVNKNREIIQELIRKGIDVVDAGARRVVMYNE